MIPTDLLAHISGRMASIVATETVDIYRQVTDSDGMGGITVSWRRVGHDIPGAKTYNSGDHSQVGGAILQEGEWVWALPIGTGKLSLETVLGLPFTVKFRATGTLANTATVTAPGAGKAVFRFAVAD